MHETESHMASTFATLTYDDEHLPHAGLLTRDPLTLYLKRLRRYVEPRRIRYFACGEYGELSLRPHYHAILFGLHPFFDKLSMDDAWQGQGFCYYGSVTYESAKYVADYAQKTSLSHYERPYAKEEEAARAPYIPFSIKSQGLGKRWALEHAEDLRQDPVIRVKGVPVSVPRYYVKLLELDPEQLTRQSWENRQQRAEKDKRNGITHMRKRITEWDRAEQREKNAQAKLLIKNKGQL